jgi:hypothetical protein
MIRDPFLVAAGLLLLSLTTAAPAQYSRYLDGSTLPGDAGWVVDGDPGTPEALGPGNSGIRQVDDNPGGGGGGRHGGGSYDEFYVEHHDSTATLNVRFRLDAYAFEPGVNPFSHTFLALTPAGNNSGPSVGIGIRNIEGADHWVAVQFILETEQPLLPSLLADFGPVATGVFNEAGLYVGNDPAGDDNVLRIFWNGSDVYNGPGLGDWGGDPGYAEFGASNYWGEGGTSTVTYDWVGYGPGYIAVPEPAGILTVLALTPLVRRRNVSARQRHGPLLGG